MKKINQQNYSLFYFLINLLILLNTFNLFISFELNNIRTLGENGFRYVRFSFNSEGDMVLDTSANPGTNKRIFYGLKSNGNYYFKNSDGSETPYKYIFINRDNENQRFEGESIFIKLNSYGNEYILGTTKNQDSYCELYKFENNEITSIKTNEIFGKLNSDIYTAMKLP